MNTTSILILFVTNDNLPISGADGFVEFVKDNGIIADVFELVESGDGIEYVLGGFGRVITITVGVS